MSAYSIGFKLGLLGLSLISANPASSQVLIDFEGLSDLEAVAGYYNGEYGGNSTGTGPSYGVRFSDGAFALVDSDVGGSGGFFGAPSPYTVAFLENPFRINVAAGFVSGFSFYYAAPNLPGSVEVYSGVDGTGELLASSDLDLTEFDFSGEFGPFVFRDIEFQGKAASISFSGVSGQFAIDNVLFRDISVVSPGAIPEPSTWAMLIIGFAAVGSTCRRRHKRSHLNEDLTALQ